MEYYRDKMPSKLQERIGFAPAVYRWIAFAIAGTNMFVFPSADDSQAPPVILFAFVGIYTVFKTLHPFGWHQGGMLAFAILSADVAVCILLVILTGGLYSPFLLYTLAPVLTSALLLDSRVTFSIATLSGAYVIAGHLANPFFPTQLSFPQLSYFLVYIIAVCLAAILPYLVNVNFRQHLQSQDILWERQRMSREIHDGTAQTLSALVWQVQLLYRRLVEMGIDLDEVRELRRLAEKARQDTKESLELLRNHTGNGSFLQRLKDYLEHLRQGSSVDFHLDAETGEIHLESPVELELLHICQEALTNIRKHSEAHNVRVKVSSADNYLRVSIVDDGRGFDALAFYRDGVQAKGHGLAIMRERAESIGGRFRVLSMPGQGTEVQIEVPVNPRRSRLAWLSR